MKSQTKKLRNSTSSFVSVFLPCVFLLLWPIHIEAVQNAVSPVAAIPVLCYHQLNSLDNSFYSINTSTFEEQMSLLKSLGYTSISPDDYLNWVLGKPINLPSKPILITFDDGIANSQPDSSVVLQKYGFRAIMFTVSGFADNPQGFFLDWEQISKMYAEGWYIQLHAGTYGHDTLTNPADPSCVDWLACRMLGETTQEYQQRVVNDYNVGTVELQVRGFLSGPPAVYALPFDDWGQYNSDKTVSEFLQPYLASRFSVVFDQDWGYRPGFNRRYRFEIHSDTTLQMFQTGLNDSRFQRGTLTPTPTTKAYGNISVVLPTVFATAGPPPLASSSKSFIQSPTGYGMIAGGKIFHCCSVRGWRYSILIQNVLLFICNMIN